MYGLQGPVSSCAGSTAQSAKTLSRCEPWPVHLWMCQSSSMGPVFFYGARSQIYDNTTDAGRLLRLIW